MQYIIAGGTGFIGQHLTRFWLKQEHQVTIIGRDPNKITSLFGDAVNAVSWDAFNDNPADVLKGADAVINLCGANVGSQRWSKARKQKILDSRIKPTTAIATACAKLGDASPRLLNASAIGVYGLQHHRKANLPAPFDENVDINSEPTDFLSDVARQWEAATLPAQEAGVPVTLLRFGVVLDKSGGALKQIAMPYYFGLGGKVGSGEQPFTWISLDDAVSAIDFLCQHNEIQGPVNLVAIRSVSQAEFAAALARALHRPAFFTMPAGLLRLVFGEMADELLLEGQHVVPMRLTNHQFKFKHPDIDTALADIFK